MINIGLDAKRAFMNFSGLGNYSRAFISAMSGLYPERRYILYTPKNRLRPGMGGFLESGSVEVRMPSGLNALFSSLLWRSHTICRDLLRDKVDLYHGLSGELPLERIPVKSVVTMHDAIFMRFPELYKPIDCRIYARKFAAACKNADAIISISKATADEIIHYFNADPAKIEVVYQGCDTIFRNSPTPEEVTAVKVKYSLPERYILSVGTIEERKNLVTTVRALKQLPEEISLVAVGRPTAYLERVKAAVAELGLERRVKFVHGASFQDFPAIYKGADALVYISIFEGFGLPVLEGITVGVPVVTSNLSSMPEAGGDAVCLVNPKETDAVARALREICYTPGFAAEMVARGYAYSRNFVEEKTAGAVNEIYNRLLR